LSPPVPILATSRPRVRAFDPEDLLPARAFPRVLSRIAMPPDQRRSILSAASRGALPAAWLEIRGLAVPPEGWRASLMLHRGPSASCLRLGVLNVGSSSPSSRRSRQLPLTARRAAQLAAAGEARIQVVWRGRDGFMTQQLGLPCLGLALVFEDPLPPYPLV
jgi:hypothetical protein